MGAVCILSKPENKGKIAFFAGIDKARFRGIVRPGDTLHLKVQVLGERLGLASCSAVAAVNGKKVVTAQFSCALGPGA